MDNLDTNVKHLTEENESLKKENARLLTRIHTLEMEVGIFEPEMKRWHMCPTLSRMKFWKHIDQQIMEH